MHSHCNVCVSTAHTTAASEADVILRSLRRQEEICLAALKRRRRLGKLFRFSEVAKRDMTQSRFDPVARSQQGFFAPPLKKQR
jgi:hypothetical protein